MTFWKNGLRFSCLRCGKCCCGEPGIVYFNPSEFDRLVAHLEKTRGLTREVIIRDYMRPHLDSYTARDDFPDGHCIFFDNGCTVYEVRPSQCRDFPFWKCNLHSKEDWDETAQNCPGMNQGKLWSAEEIRAIASKARL
ncbi:MAG: YkgJ family cysteine cluster protein [Proteobacteria bacterium]|nr:YkgJ family cysteine cluster protein [Pseudomonadota bacterium]